MMVFRGYLHYIFRVIEYGSYMLDTTYVNNLILSNKLGIYVPDQRCIITLQLRNICFNVIIANAKVLDYHTQSMRMHSLFLNVYIILPLHKLF